jgi:asparagine synthase (glutamine-hydrolysing)
MSVIFGLASLDGRLVRREDLTAMGHALDDRTYDGLGERACERIGMGVRVQAHTPEDRFERQPLASDDGRHILVFSGRVDNRTDLIADLGWHTDGALPRAPSEIPDSRLILGAYQKWGRECVSHLAGAFAFAVYDLRDAALFVVRSPIVAPPVFYHATARRLAFASASRALFALESVPRGINERKLADMLVRSPADPEATLYRDLRQVPTGAWLTAGLGGVRVEIYWKPDLRREIRFRRDAEYVEAFNALFDRVVAAQLRSASPLGAMMSGGLDSTAVTATAARLLKPRGERIAAFAAVPRIGFEGQAPLGRYVDETPLVQAVAARHENMDLVLVRPGEQMFLDDLGKLFWHLERPFINTSNRTWIEAILRTAGQRGIQVLLDGAQGNLTFSRDGRGLVPQLLATGKWSRAAAEARQIAKSGTSRSMLGVLVAHGAWPLLRRKLLPAIDGLRGDSPRSGVAPLLRYSPINPEFAVLHDVARRGREGEAHDSALSGTRLAVYSALARQDIGLFNSALESMFSVELRSPAADVRIADFCLALPEEQFLRNGEPRSLIRRAMADRLPSAVLDNRLRGQQAAEWFESLTRLRPRLSATIEEIARSELARRALDVARLRRMIDQWPADANEANRRGSEYRLVLERGLMVGKFLLWFEAGR